MAVPVFDERAGPPVPPVAVPEEVADEQAAIAAAVDGTPEEPEEDVAGAALPTLFFPLLGNEVWVLEEVVEHVGVQDWLARQLLAELVAFDEGGSCLRLVAA